MPASTGRHVCPLELRLVCLTVLHLICTGLPSCPQDVHVIKFWMPQPACILQAEDFKSGSRRGRGRPRAEPREDYRECSPSAVKKSRASGPKKAKQAPQGCPSQATVNKMGWPCAECHATSELLHIACYHAKLSDLFLICCVGGFEGFTRVYRSIQIWSLRSCSSLLCFLRARLHIW